MGVEILGHLGALYLPGAGGKPKPSPSIDKQGTWHDELRDIFETTSSITAAIDALRKKFQATIWNGVEVIPADFYTDYLDASGNPIAWSGIAAQQQNNYKTVDDVFVACRAALARFG